MKRELSSQAACAAAIRKELKAVFPAIKFSVKARSASMMTAVDVDWTDGPTTKEVEKIVNKYEYGSFNGMEDIYEYDNMREDLPQVKYLQTDRHCSCYDAVKTELLKLGAKDDWDLCSLAHQVLGKTDLTSGYKGVRRTKVTCGMSADLYEIVTGDSPAETPDVCKLCNNPTAKEELVDFSFGAWYAEICPACHAKEIEKIANEREYQIRAAVYRKEVKAAKELLAGVKVVPVIENVRCKAKFARLNKNGTLAEYESEVAKGPDAYHLNDVKITHKIKLTYAQYKAFSENLMEDWDFIAGLGGCDSDYETSCETWPELSNNKDELEKWRAGSYLLGVLVEDEEGRSMIVDPQGFNYARYVGIHIEGLPSEVSFDEIGMYEWV